MMLPALAAGVFVGLGGNTTERVLHSDPIPRLVTPGSESSPSDAIARTFDLNQVVGGKPALKPTGGTTPKAGSVAADTASSSGDTVLAPSAHTFSLIGIASAPLNQSASQATSPSLPPDSTVLKAVLFWQQPAAMSAAAVYLVGVILTIALILMAIKRGQTLPASAPAAPAISTYIANPFAQPRDDLERLAAQIRQDASTAVHAMKTPLTTIMMAMESIKRALPAEHSHSVRAATFIDVATQRLAALMDELWNAGDSLAATIVTPHERIDLTAMVREAFAQSAVGLEECGDHTHIQSDGDCTVIGPRQFLLQAFVMCFAVLRENSRADDAVSVSISRAGEMVFIRLETQGSSGAEGGDDGRDLQDMAVPQDAARTFLVLGGRAQFGHRDCQRFLTIFVPASSD
ncbi:hypothetical protein [Reyranella sp.]|uniref:hypothetical protein n=1 Tax=Reyranella sp. TaxID=1929291 RepID=UPI001203113D|nr:hypothetical protein [Reyranella sp.]TAJ90344.1 MAG: HAMP domain-containing histidine kinase [Reyranella sp.]